MGHVPAGPLPQAGQGHELPRRQHRGARALPAAVAERIPLARFGESLAASFLARRGLHLVARNQMVGRGEIDLIVRSGRRRIAVEVKTRRHGDVDPVEAFTTDKAHQVRRLAVRLGIGRVDLIAVWVGPEFVEVRWLPEVA